MAKINKDLKIIIFAVVAVVVLTAVTICLLILQKREEAEQAKQELENLIQEEDETATLTLTDFAVGDILSIEITNEYGTYEIIPIAESEGEYTIAGLENIPLDNGSLKTGVSYFANIKASKLVEENTSDLAKYGLENPLSVTEIKLEGESAVILTGNSAPVDNSTYVRKQDSKDIYIVYTYYVSRTLDSELAFIKKELTEAIDTSNPPVIKTMSIAKEGEELVVIRESPVTPEGQPIKGVHTHAFENPVGVGIDPTKGESLVYGLYGLTALEAVAYGVDKIDYEATGINNPTLIVETVGDDNYSLVVGYPIIEDVENEDGTITQSIKGYYGIFSELPDVLFIFGKASIPWLSIDYEEIMTRLFLLPGIYIISDVEIEAGDYSLTMTSEGDEQGATFKVNDEVYDNQDNFKYFYQYLISASAENIYKGEEMGELVAQFTYKYRDSELSNDVVEFYRSSEMKLVIVVNGEPLYRIKENYITRLKQNIDALLSGEEIIISW